MTSVSRVRIRLAEVSRRSLQVELQERLGA
jgi:hypothetical protein